MKLGLTGRATFEPSTASPGGALLSALLNLGYKQATAERAAENARKALGEAAPLEDQVREALRSIGRPT